MRSSIEEYDYPLINAIQKISTDFMPKFDNFKKSSSDSEILKEEYNNSLEDNAKKANNQLEPFVFDHLVSPLDKEKVNSIPSVVISSNEEFMKFYHTKHCKKELTLVYHGSLNRVSNQNPRKEENIFSNYRSSLWLCYLCSFSKTT